jgi:hypothetical protein
MSEDIKKKIGIQRKRNYLARDFQDFRGELLNHARTHFSDKIQDFSESSLGGLLLDMAAYVGDNMSFYLDHQFNELNPQNVVETKNLEAMVRNAGIKITGAAPSSVSVEFFIEIPATTNIYGKVVPNEDYIPIIEENAKLQASNGVSFYLTEPIDFGLKIENGDYAAEVTPILDEDGNILSFVFSTMGLCVSGTITTEEVSTGNFVAFRSIPLTNPNVTAVLRVFDGEGNEYYEVESLAQDTVFRKSSLGNGSSSIDVIPAPYRFITATDIQTRKMTLQFGSSDSSDDGKITNPSQLALPLYGKKAFSSFSLDPNKLLTNPSLGVSPSNTLVSITYRHGGGRSHNVEPDTITSVQEIKWVFKSGIPYEIAQQIKASLACSNPKGAAGGSSAPSLEDLRTFVTSARTMQNRVVTKEDLLARIYTMPTDFGMVYRANIIPNPENSLASILYVVCRDSSGKLSVASDALKRNLSNYLNEFRIIGDAIDILDARIVNFQINIDVQLHPSVNKYEVTAKIIQEIGKVFPKEEVNLGKPINKTEVYTAAANLPGVVSVVEVSVVNVSGETDSYTYSGISKNLNLVEKNGVYYAEPYEIFELRYPNIDIIVNVL